MASAHVVLRAPDGSVYRLFPGDLVGRVWTAALVVDDARVSEAHALVSLRDGALVLLALRRLLRVDGRDLQQVTLAPGQVVGLAEGVALTVEDVVLPEVVLALEGAGLGRRVLSGTAFLRLGPPVELLPRYAADARAEIWFTGGGWRARVDGGAPVDLVEGDALVVGDAVFRAVAVRLREAERRGTVVGTQAPLRIVARHVTAHVHRDGQPVCVLTGVPARIVSELAVMGVPAAWEAVAASVWPDEDDRNALRRRWDVHLGRLRAKLRDAGIRDDLVRADGKGNLELVLRPGDVVEDQA
ncbi:MAG: hypothetical protein Q8P18_09850 [Pseudomonadota bacterium]|nr:hypothetical protein [Pseudomonadota bacterium]